MTDTPTRAEVEALIARLRLHAKLQARIGCDGDDSKAYIYNEWQAADALTALLPLAYTETGETWRVEARKYADELFDLRNRAGCGPEQSGPDVWDNLEAAERRLAEVEAELEQAKMTLERSKE